MFSFSIIICAHNPNEKFFQRLLDAILAFENNAPPHEVIIVDNNSSPVLAHQQYVQSFLQQKISSSILREESPGLTSARIAGISRAKANWLVFFDDDNEPACTYLNAASTITESFENVAAWGPGIVTLEFPSIIYEEKFQKISTLFQHRYEEDPRFSSDKWWQDWYPAGTGLIIRKDVADKYAGLVFFGDYRLTDRKGNSLSSGGDLQIVLTAVKMGFDVGVHPDLIVKHLIAKDKLTPAYLKLLAFGTAASNVPGHLQVWKQDLDLVFNPPQSLDILKQLYFHLKVKLIEEGKLKMQLSLSAYLGRVKALYDINPNVKPSILWLVLCRIMQVR